MTTIHHSPPPGATFQSFAIYEDPDDQSPPSPSEAYDEEISFNSERSLPGEDEPLASIEHGHEHEHEHEQDFDDELQPYRSSFTSRPSAMSAATSRRVSGMTTTSFISSLPSEISISSKPAAPANHAGDSRYTPRKERPPFRNPASVRAMQMSSPPPFAAFENPRERLKGAYKLATPSRSGRSETPVSASGSRRRRESQGHVQQSPVPVPTPQQHLPLVLLHVTIIPMQFPYSPELMAKAMPEWLVENYKLLEEKLQDIVLMRRGLLISHPREEYDVLEERILESLELKTPRLLKCGHFVSPEDEDEHDDEDDGVSFTDDATGRGSRMSGGTLTVEEDGEWKHHAPEADDESVCTDCNRHVKRPGNGIGKGSKKWDLKIYAANGLMRAGAWSAAWSEMERCDVEISPWIPEDVRKTLERKVIEHQEREKQKQLYEAEVLRRVEEETTRLKRLEDEAEELRKTEEAALQKEIEAAALQKRMDDEAAEKKRLDDSLNERIEEAKESIRLEFEMQALQEADSVAERFRVLEEALKKEQSKASAQLSTPGPPSLNENMRSQSRGRTRSSSRRPHIAEIPLSTLLSNYFLVLATDRRNLAIVALGALVAYLSMHTNPTLGMQLASSSLPSTSPDDHFLDPISSVIITTTTTATSIATSISTITVTQLHHSIESVQGTPVPSAAEIMSAVLESSVASDEVIYTTIPHPESSEAPIASSSEHDFRESSESAVPSQSMPASLPLDSSDSSPPNLSLSTSTSEANGSQSSEVAEPSQSTSASITPVFEDSGVVLGDASPVLNPALPILESPESEQMLKSEPDAEGTILAALPVHDQEL
ncbi:hypothetical protein K505DRAFT_328236 [Melanomma pulvis-pyrius CBS 109.77]|uniref:Pathway-specific nitrogen regulator n=1 Tax=Melanomma pulvis-pyrius CBS 109.77 TaxID=1314802 RepID=A0A6A6X0K0_9PLEO|nr:hypothetical protein K505DRAFT_328236 [Melanomma pulvis-pyrius CBS 109.77]